MTRRLLVVAEARNDIAEAVQWLGDRSIDLPPRFRSAGRRHPHGIFSAALLLTLMMHLIAGIAAIVALLAVGVVAALLTAVAISGVRRNRRGSGSLGAAMLEMQSLLEPEKRHTVRAVRADEPEGRADSGAPPEG